MTEDKDNVTTLSDIFPEKESDSEESTTTIDLNVPTAKERKVYDLKWKSRLARLMKHGNSLLKSKFDDSLTNDEINLISEDWEDVLNDVAKSGPLYLKVGLTVITSALIVYSFVHRVASKRKSKGGNEVEDKGETGPSRNDTRKSKA